MHDYTDDLAAVENAIRQVIERRGQDTNGQAWLDTLINPDKVKEWKRRQTREANVRASGVPEQRPIYFSDFYDLEQIIMDNWTIFEPVFLDQTQTAAYLKKLR